VNGEPDFVGVDPRKIAEAHQKHVCWICGGRVIHRKAFTIGPMCAVNRVSAEPPAHAVCARFAVTACPFLSRPLAKRAHHPTATYRQPPGLMLERNPGVVLIWETSTYRVERQPEGGMLFRIGSPSRTSWWCEGREATRAEIVESLRTGLPALVRVAQQNGPEAIAHLQALVERTVKLVPVEREDPTTCQQQQQPT
jgi:hypothetical protein